MLRPNQPTNFGRFLYLTTKKEIHSTATTCNNHSLLEPELELNRKHFPLPYGPTSLHGQKLRRQMFRVFSWLSQSLSTLTAHWWVKSPLWWQNWPPLSRKTWVSSDFPWFSHQSIGQVAQKSSKNHILGEVYSIHFHSIPFFESPLVHPRRWMETNRWLKIPMISA